MRIAELVEALGRLAPWEKAAVWDRVGLQIGDPASSVGSVLVCHEITDRVVADVEGHGVKTVVSYHPLLFEPSTRLVAGPGAAGRAYRLAVEGVAVIVVHTNLDVAVGAERLALALGLEQPRPFGRLETTPAYKTVTFVPPDEVDAVASAMADAGAGVIGGYSNCSFKTEGIGTFYAGPGTDPTVGEGGALNQVQEVRLEMVVPSNLLSGALAALFEAHPYEEPAVDVFPTGGAVAFAGRIGTLLKAVELDVFAADVGEVLEAAHVRVAGSGLVRRVAVLPGSGSGFIPETAEADVIVTGDVSHHRAVAALDRGMGVVDPGHVPTERPGLEALYDAVDELIEDVQLVPATEVWQP